MTEENKAIVRRVYEIVSTGDFGRKRSGTTTRQTVSYFQTTR
jgi:hypothetical protein